MRKLTALAAFLALPLGAQFATRGGANTFSGYNNFASGSMRWAERTVAGPNGLPSAASANGKVFVVTDATSNSDCTVGGSSGFSAICRSNGSSWISIGGGSGSVSSVATGCGTSGGPITATGTLIATRTPKSDATAGYTFLNGDCGKRIIRSNSGAMSDTLPQASGFDTNWFAEVHNNGPGAQTITATVSTFQGGAAAITLYAGQFAFIIRNGADYSASGEFVLCPTCAGAIELAAGTAPIIVANTAIRYAPTSVTGYTLRELAAACTGILLLTNTANDMVPTCLASTGTGNAVRANNAVMDSLTVTTSCTGCGGLTGLTNASSVPFVQSSNVLTQDTGFSFNATGTVTPSAGLKYLNLASTNNGVGLSVTSTNLLRGSYGAANGDGLQISDQGGVPIWMQTYSTTTSAFSGITKSKAFHGSGTAPSVGTCGTIGAGSTNNAGFITTVTGACAPVVTFSVTATTGWSCPPASNSTTPANSFVQTASSTTTATFTGTSGSNDVIRYVCVPY